jgi:hypothetical protein
VDFKETAIALDPNHEASIFEKEIMEKLLKRYAICIKKEILQPQTTNVEMVDTKEIL